MSGSPQTEAVDIVRRLCKLHRLDPVDVAAVLGRQPRVAEEDEFSVTYELYGGSAVPFADVRVIRLKEDDRGMANLDVAPTVFLSVRGLHDAVSDGRLPVPIFSDPRNPEGKTTYAYKIPVGELRLQFMDLEGQADRLVSVGLTESPLVNWEE